MFKFFIKENKNLVIGFSIVIIAIPVIFLVSSPIGIIPKDIGLQLVGYAGSIIGGFFTLYGVWWTIINQNKKQKEELAIQFKPLIEIKSNYVPDESFENCKSNTHNDDSELTVQPKKNFKIISPPKKKEKEICIYLLLMNEGRGEALKIKHQQKNRNVVVRQALTSPEAEICPYLPANKNTPIQVFVNNFNNHIKDINLDITYTDLYSFNQYTSKFKIQLNTDEYLIECIQTEIVEEKSVKL